jgi:DNA processing protein
VADDLVLLAAARLRVGGRRLRVLARGDADAVRTFIQHDSARRLAEARRDAYADRATLARISARLIALADETYPAGLRDLPDPPAFLTVRGTLPNGGIAVIGTRSPSPAAAALAAGLVTELGEPLVSGLAHGIDAAAHRAALAAGLAQIAYVGTGLARTYPPDHAELADAIAAAGAVASERLPEEPVTRWALVRRDRLQAAHGRAVVLVESEADGGAMQTLAFARTLGRPRYALDCDASGNRRAIAEGAIPLPWKLQSAVLHFKQHQTA